MYVESKEESFNEDINENEIIVGCRIATDQIKTLVGIQFLISQFK